MLLQKAYSPSAYKYYKMPIQMVFCILNVRLSKSGGGCCVFLKWMRVLILVAIISLRRADDHLLQLAARNFLHSHTFFFGWTLVIHIYSSDFPSPYEHGAVLYFKGKWLMNIILFGINIANDEIWIYLNLIHIPCKLYQKCYARFMYMWSESAVEVSIFVCRFW